MCFASLQLQLRQRHRRVQTCSACFYRNESAAQWSFEPAKSRCLQMFTLCKTKQGKKTKKNKLSLFMIDPTGLEMMLNVSVFQWWQSLSLQKSVSLQAVTQTVPKPQEKNTFKAPCYTYCDVSVQINKGKCPTGIYIHSKLCLLLHIWVAFSWPLVLDLLM